MKLFAKDGLEFFGIRTKVKEIGYTELIELKIEHLFMDFLFLMEDDTYRHFEFQTTDNPVQDARRFRAYEAIVSNETGKDVITYAVYSNKIHKKAMSFRFGLNRYRFHIINLSDRNADSMLEYLNRKTDAQIPLTKEDMLGLTFLPVMGGKQTYFEKINGAFKVTKKITQEYGRQVEAMLYAFATKFLDGDELRQIKEAIKMTRLGEMLVQDGYESGKEAGKREGRREGRREGMEKGISLARRVLRMSFQGISPEEIAKECGISLDVVSNILNEQ